MRDTRAQLRNRQALPVMASAPRTTLRDGRHGALDRDFRPAPGDANDELARLLALSREQEHERPERVAAAIGLLAFVIVACLAALGARAVLG